MTGDEGRHVCEALWPQAEREPRCQPCGVMEREGQRNLGLCGRAMVISAGTPGGASPADVLRSSLACEVPRVVRSACERWFAAPLARCMEALAAHALAYARAPEVERSGPLGAVPAWSSVEATTVTGRDARRAECPGAGDSAALTGHPGRAVGCGAPGGYHVSPARAHDRRPLQLDASWRGCGVLADLASASLARRRAGDAHGVRLGRRRQAPWPPTVDDVARGQGTQAFFPGADGEALRAEETLVRDGRAMDADGPVGPGRPARPRRRGGVQTPTGSGCCRTPLPPRIDPRPVADRYRVRWDVARRLRLDQAVHRLEARDAERPCSLTTLVPAARRASTIAARRAPTHHVPTRPPPLGTPRREAPRPPRRVALPLAVSWQSMAQAVALQGVAATRRWNKMAEVRTQRGRDPNWRRRPSVVDQLRGWKRQPVVPKTANRGDVSTGNFKAAA